MTKSVFSKEYEFLTSLLIEIRTLRNLTQDDLAKKLGKPQSFVSKYERGERRLDVIEFLEICTALETNVNQIVNKIIKEMFDVNQDYLTKAGLSIEEISFAIEKNPSLRGVIIGYLGEDKFQEKWLNNPLITEIHKKDDHDRTGKGDRVFVYKGREFIIEVKSLQTNTIVKTNEGFSGKAQVDASDCRDIILSDKSTVHTTLLKVDEFDILAVSVFGFEGKWNFVFAENKDLPRSKATKYSDFQRSELLASLVPITWPPKEPFVEDLFLLLEKIIARQ